MCWRKFLAVINWAYDVSVKSLLGDKKRFLSELGVSRKSHRPEECRPDTRAIPKMPWASLINIPLERDPQAPGNELSPSEC